MKTYIKILLFYLFPLLGLAQPAPSTDKPYMRVSTPRVATSIDLTLNDYTKAITTIQYMDGLGRPMQSVGYKASPTVKDLLVGTNTLDQVYLLKQLSVFKV